MRLIIGGAHQGKLDWYLRTSGQSMQQVADGETLPLESLPDRPVLNHLHRWVYRMVQQGKDVQAAMERYLQCFPDAVILCDEVGCGVVPIDPVERQWREETGAEGAAGGADLLRHCDDPQANKGGWAE